MAKGGFLSVVTPDDLTAAEQQRALDAEEAASQAEEDEGYAVSLAGHIRKQFEIALRHRSTTGLDRQLLDAYRMFNGEYDPQTLAEIRQFGGSEVYSRVVASKCRGASALLRDIFFSAGRQWEVEPTPEPDLPANTQADVDIKLQQQLGMLMEQGIEPPVEAVMMLREELVKEARREEYLKAKDEAKVAEQKMDDILVEGRFYNALADILNDLPIFPYVCMKGPVVRVTKSVKWENGTPVEKNEPKMFWERVSPFDVYWTPGVNDISEGDVMERLRWTRRHLASLLDMPGWNTENVRKALQEYGEGYHDFMDPVDAERAHDERREDPNWNRSGMIDAMEFHGSVPGYLLAEWGFGPLDAEREFMVSAWVVGRYILKCIMMPSPRRRHPYHITSFSKVPGTPIGHALPDLVGDLQNIANACMRAAVNNMSIASGPQVVVLANRFDRSNDTDELYPWKRWHMTDMPGQGAIPPVSFFQPQSNAQELFGVYERIVSYAEEISAIPRYQTGTGASGGAGRTSSGLAMLIGNANKLLMTVVANIDNDIVEPMLMGLYDMLMLTQAGDVPLRGDETVSVKGVSAVLARESERARQLEFLGITANPIDTQITGLEGRAEVLRAVSDDIGLRGEKIVPTREEIQDRVAQGALLAQEANQARGDQAGGPAASTGPQENVVQPRANPGG